MSNLENRYSRFKKQIVPTWYPWDPAPGACPHSESEQQIPHPRSQKARPGSGWQRQGCDEAYGKDLAMFGRNPACAAPIISSRYCGGLPVPALGLGVAGFFTAGLAAAGAGTGEVMVAVLM